MVLLSILYHTEIHVWGEFLCQIAFFWQDVVNLNPQVVLEPP